MVTRPVLIFLSLVTSANLFAVTQSFREITAKADADFSAGRLDAALEGYNHIIALNLPPRLASVAVMKRGTCYYARHNIERAIADYDQALRLDSKNAAAYDNRGTALDARGDWEDALKDYNESMRLNPRNADVYINRGTVLLENGDLNGAFADYTKALTLNPREEYAHAGRTEFYLRQNEPEKALKEANAVISIAPGEGLGYHRRACAFMALGKYAQAEADIKTALRLKNYDPKTPLSLLAWFRATCPDPRFRNGKQALEIARQNCLSTNFFGYACLDTLAAAYAEVGDFEQALNYQTQALEKAPSHFPQLRDMKERLELYKKQKPYRDEPERKPRRPNGAATQS
jgi:tetratricopeptide (TPR) repeat protein